MPDWSYRTVFRPLLFRLPYAAARDLCLGFLGTLAGAPLGASVIEFLGHMRPDSGLRTNLAGLELTSPVILGPYLDVKLAALPALARFGFGAVVVGPVAAKPTGDPRNIRRDDRSYSLRLPDPPTTRAAEAVATRLAQLKLPLPVIARLKAERGQPAAGYTAECAVSLARLAPYSAAVALEVDDATSSNWSPLEWQHHVELLARAAVAPQVALPVLVCLRANASELDLQLVSVAVAAGACGIIVDGRVQEGYAGDWLVGGASLRPALATVERLRREIGAEVPIIAGGAVDPLSAMELLAAGASAVQVDAGLVFSGPGLPKRINDAVLFARHWSRRPGGASPANSQVDPAGSVPPAGRDLHPAAMSWLWAFLLGIAMLIGGTLALALGCTRVVLPYDEAYLGMTAAELTTEVNPRLLDFMAHDRVTLAGTMLAIGIQYVFLAWQGIRRGQHWAKLSVLASAFAGFGSFFLFLGFGYFDPFHAFVTAILFQFLLLAAVGRLGPPEPPSHPSLRDDWPWRLAQWGQLLLIVEAVAVVSAGATIALIGATTVFVPEDLEFMRTTPEALQTANPRLIPVVAHDRASFGGMLISVGLATLLPALWGIRQGETWVAWMLGLAGTIGYGATLAIHLRIGYTDPHHLAPAVTGLVLLWLALALLLPLLVPPPEKHRQEWNAILCGLRRPSQ